MWLACIRELSTLNSSQKDVKKVILSRALTGLMSNLIHRFCAKYCKGLHEVHYKMIKALGIPYCSFSCYQERLAGKNNSASQCQTFLF